MNVVENSFATMLSQAVMPGTEHPKCLLPNSPVARLLDRENAIASIMNKARYARLNAAGGWGDLPPIPGVALALKDIVDDPARFHLATRYSETGGIAQLREAIVEKLETPVFNRPNVSPDTIIVSSGGATQLGFQALLLFGSPVLLPDPVYANYLDQAELAGLQVIRYPILGQDGEFYPQESPDFLLCEFERICCAIPLASVVIVSPDNPTGYIWPDEVLDRFIRIAERHGVVVILDRSYGSFYFGKRPEHLSWSSATHANLVALESFSKSLSLLGLRLGYSIATPEISTKLEALTQRITLCPGTLEQLALFNFLSGCNGNEIAAYLETARCAYHDAFCLARATLSEVSPHIKTINSDGGFYLMVRIAMDENDDALFCKALFDSERLLVVPGQAFGKTTHGWIRTAFAPHVRNPKRLSKVYRTLAKRIKDWNVEQ